MSRDFSQNVANFMSLGANAIGPKLGSASGHSVSFYGYWDLSAANSEPWSFWNGDGACSSLYQPVSGTGRVYAARVNADLFTKYASVVTAPTTLTPYFYGIKTDWSANPYTVEVFRNGSSIFTGNTPAATGGNYVHTTATYLDCLGCWCNSATAPTSSTRQMDGKLGEFAMWNKTLTTGDFIALGQGACPLKVQPQSLIAYWRLNGQGTSTTEIEIINGLTGTINGTIALANHPLVR